MNKILLIGNHYYDEFTCLLNGKLQTKFGLGGIDNCEPCFDLSKCEVSKFYLYGAKCNFIINKFGEDCVVDYKWKHPSFTREYFESQLPLLDEAYDWVHICYANTITKDDMYLFNKIRTNGLSCDLVTNSREESKGDFGDKYYYLPEFLQRMSLIFMSKSTDWALSSWLRENKNIKAKLFLHSSTNHEILDTDRIKILLHDTINSNIDYKYTVGAGDKLAAYFIDGIINQKFSMKLAQQYAKEKVDNWLKEINNELS